MADSTVMEINKMKVVDLQKELKSRGLSSAGHKADLVDRLQAAMTRDDHADIALDSDEIDSDGVLEDEDDKSQTDILDEGVDTLNEELALSDNPEPKKWSEVRPQRTLKRKITLESSKDKTPDTTLSEIKEAGTKKIVLNRAISLTSSTEKKIDEIETDKPTTEDSPPVKVKITADLDPKARLEMRAKRFGLPIKTTEAERKEARKQRFGQGTATKTTLNSITHTSGNVSENLDKLKKRAERFGQSVSKIMTDIENKEKLEKRKAKFANSK